jgi:hypothetical protein
MHLHDLFVVDALGWWVCLKANGWMGLVDVMAGVGGVMKVLSHFSTRCCSCCRNVACVCTRVVRVCDICCF